MQSLPCCSSPSRASPSAPLEGQKDVHDAPVLPPSHQLAGPSAQASRLSTPPFASANISNPSSPSGSTRARTRAAYAEALKTEEFAMANWELVQIDACSAVPRRNDECGRNFQSMSCSGRLLGQFLSQSPTRGRAVSNPPVASRSPTCTASASLITKPSQVQCHPSHTPTTGRSRGSRGHSRRSPTYTPPA